jgi:hypothetical protein
MHWNSAPDIMEGQKDNGKLHYGGRKIFCPNETKTDLLKGSAISRIPLPC